VTRRGRTLTLAVGGSLAILLLIVGYLLPVPYVRMRPGPVFNALGEVAGEPVVTIEGARTYETPGVLDITTVVEDGSPGGRLTLFQAVRGWLDPSMRVIPRDMLYPPEDFDDEDASERLREQGVAQMKSSEQSAVVAALRHVGEPVTTIVVVGETLPDTPAAEVLEAGDVVVAVNGKRIGSPEGLRRVISDGEVGDQLRLRIERDGERESVQVKTIESTDKPIRPVIGVTPTITFESPVDVSIALANVGGPSAGLVFALAVVDKLTPESLIDDYPVAGTGEITPRGRVGAIGGIAQKMAGARADGAEVFLAPRANCSDVVGHVPDGLRVIAVKTLDEAVDSLENLNEPGASIPSC